MTYSLAQNIQAKSFTSTINGGQSVTFDYGYPMHYIQVGNLDDAVQIRLEFDNGAWIWVLPGHTQIIDPYDLGIVNWFRLTATSSGSASVDYQVLCSVVVS